MGRRIAEFPWHAHPLGPVEAWPQSLKTATNLILGSQHPMWIGWGTDVSFLYNDAYLHVLGLAKHPWALGRPAAEVWAEIWDVCGPLADRVFREGEASFVDDVRLFMNRGDFLEETYYSFSYSPIRDESGDVGGLFCPSNDVTAKVVGARRLRLLAELAACALRETSVTAASASTASALQDNRDDIPFALLYLADDGECDLQYAVGISAEAGRQLRRPVADVLHNRRSRRFALTALPAPPLGAADKPVTEALAVPLSANADSPLIGVLVAGINPTSKFDTEYESFFDLVGSNIGLAIHNARVVEEEKNRAEALAALDKAKTVFFSNVSHELRTPLTLLLGPIGEMLGKPAAGTLEENRELLQLAYRNGLRLQKHVNTLLDFSRIEAGRTDPVYSPVDLATLTADLASNFRSACDGAGLELLVDCPPLGEPAYVDVDMWEKIVLNLLSNAFKFTLVGSIAVRLQIVGEWIELTVKDTGVGIPAAELPKLFDRFHRIDAQQSRTHEGTGIGLALVNELVHLHGGTAVAESETGSGTTMRVRIPRGGAHLNPAMIVNEGQAGRPDTTVAQYLAEVDATMSVVEEPPAKPASGRDRGRILLADDNRDLRDFVSRILSASHDVFAYEDGSAALEALRRDRFDLVITDVMMPRMDGFELLNAIRSDILLRTIPVMMLSARAGEEAAIGGLIAGADDYLVKPFTSEELRARVSAQIRVVREQQKVLDRTKRIVEAFQEGFLPSRLPQTARLRIDAVYQAAEADALIGGDWFDAMRLPDGRYIISIGDVTGHGLNAAAVASRLRHAVSDYALGSHDVAEILERTNAVLQMEYPETYATALVALIDADCTSLTYASAGHPPPLLADTKDMDATELPIGGLPLGVIEKLDLKCHQVHIPEYATLAFYTDGLVEFARDAVSAQATLQKAVGRLVGDRVERRPAVAVRDLVLAGAAAPDDVALIVAQFSPASDQSPERGPDARIRNWRCDARRPDAIHSCRREVMEYIRSLSSDERSLFEAEVVVGELLANTIEHAPGMVDVRLDWTGEKPVLSVGDRGPGMSGVPARLPPDTFSESGRGFFLIKTFAADVSVSGSGNDGTEVRAVLPVRRDHPA
jgi:signal transduction histidine kinase/serine phosphatase RsbU (regulator of sigma subunit)